MKISRAFYFFHKAVESIRRNPFINLITVGVVVISFLIFSTFVMLFINLNNLLSFWEEKVHIEVFLESGLGTEASEKAVAIVRSMPEVEEVAYISKNEALNRFRDSLADMGAVIEDLGENPLPPSLEIRLNEKSRDYDKIKSTAEKIRTEIKGVEDIVFGQEWIERFSASLAIFRLSGIIIGALLMLATIFIVSNTIKLTVYARKEELEIMRLMGATNSFIKLPFFIEGALQGLAGSSIAIAALYLIHKLAVGRFFPATEFALSSGKFQLLFLPPATIMFILSGGAALGVLGSFVSLGRFLKV